MNGRLCCQQRRRLRKARKEASKERRCPKLSKREVKELELLYSQFKRQIGQSWLEGDS